MNTEVLLIWLVVITVVAAVAVWRVYLGRNDRVWMVMHAHSFYKKGQVIERLTLERWVVVKVVDSMHIRVRPLPLKRSAA